MRHLCFPILVLSTLFPGLAAAAETGAQNGNAPSQSPSQSQQPTQTVFHGAVEHGFLVAPDFKFTTLDGRFANLAGGYGGWVIDRRFLLGGGAYTLTNGDRLRKMTYGGGVLEYFFNPDPVLNLSVRGLIGGGTATVGGGYLYDPRAELDFGHGFPFGDVFGRAGLDPGFLQDRFRHPDGSPTEGVRSSFFIAEPEVNVMLNLTQKFRLSFGGSYRFIGGARGLSDRIDGFSGNLALKLSFF
jgi:hypothetical protein